MGGWRIFADTGGTFTDALGIDPKGNFSRCKVLSRSCLRCRLTEKGDNGEWVLDANWPLPDGFFAGYHLVDESGASFRIVCHSTDPHRIKIESDKSASFSIGQRVEIQSPEEPPVLAARFLTGTVLNDSLPLQELRLATTRGTNALLERRGQRPLLLVNKGFADLCRIGDQKRPDLFSLKIPDREVLHGKVLEVSGRISSAGLIVEPLDLEALVSELENAGIPKSTVVVVSLLNSYANPVHEEKITQRLKALGWCHVVSSANVSPRIHYLRRTQTALINAYLLPVMKSYLDRVQAPLANTRFRIMSSAGGLISRPRFRPVDSLLSGPAGGIQGAAYIGARAGLSRMIAFDMGGTSTDVSRIHGDLPMQSQHKVGAAIVASPSLKVETVAAGGGSVCGFDGDSFFVGPESAGAYPGPASYGYGGPLAVTDVNLLLGRLDPASFGIPVDRDRAQHALDKLCEEGGVESGEALLGDFMRMANEKMANAIRSVSLQEGEDPADYGMICFGGAGGLHAAEIAEILAMDTIIVPADAGLLSALGLARARLECRKEKTILKSLDEVITMLPEWSDSLLKEAQQTLIAEGCDVDRLQRMVPVLELRIKGQESTLDIPWQTKEDVSALFAARFHQVFGYQPELLDMEVVSLKVAVRVAESETTDEVFEASEKVQLKPHHRQRSWFGDWLECPVYKRRQLTSGCSMAGPAIVADDYSTTVIPPGWHLQVGSEGSLQLKRFKTRTDSGIDLTQADQVMQRELFQQRCAAIVEEMGVQLQRTAISPNIRERLDFSCALLDSHGRLLVNAPHIPVHLGALGLCVREAARMLELEPGNVWITNDPGCGGSHLPDITLIKPVFDKEKQLVGYVANRAHHAELGGRTPGSMPPMARNLAEEGVRIVPQYWIRKGGSQRDSIERLLKEGKWPSRNPAENLADLDAQMAANQRGEEMLLALLGNYNKSLAEPFEDLFKYAEDCMRRRLKALNLNNITVEGCLDDGHRIMIRVEKSDECLKFDFTGTDPVHPGSFNATPAIVRSGLLYVLRLIIPEGIPLNEGLFEPLEVTLPECFLNPHFAGSAEHCPAVVGGNVETSQLLVDMLVRALGLCAGSQRTMNNFLFGNDHLGYYETIGGGAGAGPGFNGGHGVHTHMTNTAITDAEVLEQRFPLRVRKFALRKNSAGAGQWRGGEGLIRHIEFLEPMEVSLLSQSRKYPPQGVGGGKDGSCGWQQKIRADGRTQHMEGITHAHFAPGESIEIHTPGGGGWGR
jgi:5-oxoprolinase (ATP-hydrolysing)